MVPTGSVTFGMARPKPKPAPLVGVSLTEKSEAEDHPLFRPQPPASPPAQLQKKAITKKKNESLLAYLMVIVPLLGLAGFTAQVKKTDRLENNPIAKARTDLNWSRFSFNMMMENQYQGEQHGRQTLYDVERQLGPKFKDAQQVLEKTQQQRRSQIVSQHMFTVASHIQGLSGDEQVKLLFEGLAAKNVTSQDADKINGIIQDLQAKVPVKDITGTVHVYHQVKYTDAFNQFVDLLKPYTEDHAVLEKAKQDAQKAFQSIDANQDKYEESMNRMLLLFMLTVVSAPVIGLGYRGVQAIKNKIGPQPDPAPPNPKS